MSSPDHWAVTLFPRHCYYRIRDPERAGWINSGTVTMGPSTRWKIGLVCISLVLPRIAASTWNLAYAIHCFAWVGIWILAYVRRGMMSGPGWVRLRLLFGTVLVAQLAAKTDQDDMICNVMQTRWDHVYVASYYASIGSEPQSRADDSCTAFTNSLNGTFSQTKYLLRQQSEATSRNGALTSVVQET